MLMGEGMGERLCFGARDRPQVFYPSLLLLDGLKVFGDGAEIFETSPVGDEIALLVRATLCTHRRANLIHILTLSVPPRSQSVSDAGPPKMKKTAPCKGGFLFSGVRSGA